MNRLIRSLVTGGIVGAAVGVTMVVLQKRAGNTGAKPMMNGRIPPKMTRVNDMPHGAVRMVRDNTMRWTSAIKNNTEALSKRLSRRLT